jgi:hypothetical protein
MQRLLLIVAATLLSTAAFAGSPDATQTLAAIAPAAQKVYPPLPTLAMLPASIGDDDELPASRAIAKKSRKTRHVVADCKCSAPEPRLVVSDDTRAYLKDVDARLDAALAPGH